MDEDDIVYEDDIHIEEENTEHAPIDDAAPIPSRRWRSWMLLLVVLVIGLMMLGLFLATRPTPMPLPTLKPPWLV